MAKSDRTKTRLKQAGGGHTNYFQPLHEERVGDRLVEQQDGVPEGLEKDTVQVLVENPDADAQTIASKGLASLDAAVAECPLEELALEQHQVSDGVSDCVSATSSRASTTSWFEVQFQLSGDAVRFKLFVRICLVFTWMYTVSACISFFSSLYIVSEKDTLSKPLRSSNVDTLVMISNIMVIDITSALFVVVGFFASFMLSNIIKADAFELTKIVVIYTVLDVWLCTIFSAVAGGIFHLTRQAFHTQDILITLLEGLSCLRVFEVSQNRQSMHSLNPTAWPVLCLLWAFVLTPLTMAGNERIFRCLPQFACTILLSNVCMPIVVISLFALFRDDTNIFFINATHTGYRILEYNVGVLFYFFSQKYPHATVKTIAVFQIIFFPVVTVFAFVWWAQIGIPIHPDLGTCIRMYFFSPCIQMHHGFLMRGCVLGLCVISKILALDTANVDNQMLMALAHSSHVQKNGTWLPSAMTAILLIWPMGYTVQLMLEINFNVLLVQDNAIVLVLIIPLLTFLLSLLWNSTWKLVLFDRFESFLDTVCSCLHSRRCREGHTPV